MSKNRVWVRIVVLLAAVGFLFSVLVFRLAVVQLWNGPRLAEGAFRQRAVQVPLELPRGVIYDRNWRPLSDGYWRRVVVVFPGQVDRDLVVAETLGPLVNQGSDELLRRFQKARGEPWLLVPPSGEELDQAVSEGGLPGVLVTLQRVRYGPRALAGHTVGYVRPSDGTGVSGLEKAFDSVLRGRYPASILALVDGKGNLIPGLGFRRREPGQARNHLRTTLDVTVQETVESVLGKQGVRKGAVVVVDVPTGDILAVASRPGYRQDRPDLYLNSPGEPFLNRAVQAFTPGSVFKVVVAAAALEEGVVDLYDTFFCPGYVDVSGYRFGCYEKDGHGLLTFGEALARSCNAVFVEVGLRLGRERIMKYARAFGLGQSTGLPLGQEVSGHLPPPWETGPVATGNLALGQGSLTATPVQMAALVAAVANDGLKPTLRLVQEVRADGGEVKEVFPQRSPVRVISRTTARKLKTALGWTLSRGTAASLDIPAYLAAGKTGTAETGRTDSSGKKVTHAWFAGFAPLSRPRYAVVVFVEEGGAGPVAAAPIFGAIVEELLGWE